MNLGKNLIVLEQVDSTQDVALKMAKEGAPEWSTIMSGSQTCGRGRMGRNWVSPSGKNLALSLILRPDCEPKFAPLYGLMAAVATVQTIEQFCPHSVVRVKWPNDIISGDRKIAGILPQAQINSNRIDFVIIGLGLNVNSTEADFPLELRNAVTSMHSLGSGAFDVSEVAVSFLECMHQLYTQSIEHGFSILLDLWVRKWAHRGRMLSRSDVTGVAEGIDEMGALLLRASDGSLVKVSGGEVSA